MRLRGIQNGPTLADHMAGSQAPLITAPSGLLLIVALLLLPSTLCAQSFGLDDTWSRYPQTPAVSLVKAAISNGFCEQPAVDFINSFHQVPAAFVPAGTASLPSNTIQWYAKGPTHCDGKFQFTSPDGPYGQGWEIRFNPSTWVNGLPTQWQIHPFAEPSAESPPPVVTPPAPQPLPVPSVDFSQVIAQIQWLDADLRAAIIADGTQTRLAVDNPGWLKRALSNPVVIGALTAISTWAATYKVVH